MDDLVTWFRAQLDEDERVARAAERFWHGIRIESATEAEEDHARCWDPVRVLAEVDAKRRIIDWAIYWRDGDYAPWNDECIKLLALPYADRPGFDPAWAPVEGHLSDR